MEKENLEKASRILVTMQTLNALMLDDCFSNQDKEFYRTELLKCYDMLKMLK